MTGVHVKPASPPSSLVWGCLAAKVSALEGLAGHAEPGAYLDALAREGRVHGVDFGTEFVDIGTPKRCGRRRNEVLVTGHHGYIGSVTAPLLAAAGHEVTGLDTLFYGAATSPRALRSRRSSATCAT